MLFSVTDRLQDDVIILNICHYAYTSSMLLYSSLCNYYCVIFQNVEYVDECLSEQFLHLRCFLQTEVHSVSLSFRTTRAFLTFRCIQNTLHSFLVLISSNFSSSTTRNLFSCTLDVSSGLQSSSLFFLVHLYCVISRYRSKYNSAAGPLRSSC